MKVKNNIKKYYLKYLKKWKIKIKYILININVNLFLIINYCF